MRRFVKYVPFPEERRGGRKVRLARVKEEMPYGKGKMALLKLSDDIAVSFWSIEGEPGSFHELHEKVESCDEV